MQPNYAGYNQPAYQPFPYTPTPQGPPQGYYQNPAQNNIQMQLMANQPIQYQQVVIMPIKNGIQNLADCQGIYIKQQFQAMEAITGCESPNVFKVYPADVNGTRLSDHAIFKCKEQSGWCSRQCLPGDCRPFNMKVSNEDGTFSYTKLSFDKTLFLHLERPYKCTCCCFNRPTMKVSLIENGQNVYFGKIRNPCYSCALGCEVEDAKGNLKYVIEGSCCQLGYLCMGCPCKSCQEFNFEVRDVSGQLLTRLQKQSAGCCKSCVGDCDNFALGFPVGSSAEDKALLMSAALFMDYMYFENKQKSAVDIGNIVLN